MRITILLTLLAVVAVVSCHSYDWDDDDLKEVLALVQKRNIFNKIKNAFRGIGRSFKRKWNASIKDTRKKFNNFGKKVKTSFVSFGHKAHRAFKDFGFKTKKFFVNLGKKTKQVFIKFVEKANVFIKSVGIKIKNIDWLSFAKKLIPLIDNKVTRWMCLNTAKALILQITTLPIISEGLSPLFKDLCNKGLALAHQKAQAAIAKKFAERNKKG